MLKIKFNICIVFLFAFVFGTNTLLPQDIIYMDLILDVATHSRIEGKLIYDDRGLKFTSISDEDIISVEIKTLDDKLLIELFSEDDNIYGEFLKGELTVTISRIREPVSVVSGSNISALDILYEGDFSVFDELANIPEYSLMPTLSFALGYEGYLGVLYPSALTIHQLALGISNHLADYDEISGDPIHPAEYPSIVYRIKHPFQDELTVPSVDDLFEIDLDDVCDNPVCSASGCTDEQLDRLNNLCSSPRCEEPSEEDDCFGRCGPGCDDCWDQVCGDCCRHPGCTAHDANCRTTLGDLVCYSPSLTIVTFIAGGGCAA